MKNYKYILLLCSFPLLSMNTKEELQLMDTQEAITLCSNMWNENETYQPYEPKSYSRVYYCGECRTCFDNKKKCALHINDAHPSQTKPLLICPVEGCESVFVAPRNFFLHQCLHDKPLICTHDNCHQSFINYADFNNHKRKHVQSIDKISCKHCSITVTRKDMLLRHERTIHLFCRKHEPYQFDSRKHMISHEQKFHKRAERNLRSQKIDN